MAKIPCSGKTAAGAACRAPASAGGLCFFHANPNSAKSLGQIGGRKNRRSVVHLEVPDDMTAADVCRVESQAIRLVLSGDLRAREASALVQLCNSLFRGIQTTDLEARLARLEQQSRTSVDNNPASSRSQEDTCAGTGAQPGDVDTQESENGAEGKNDGSGKDGKA